MLLSPTWRDIMHNADSAVRETRKIAEIGQIPLKDAIALVVENTLFLETGSYSDDEEGFRKLVELMQEKDPNIVPYFTWAAMFFHVRYANGIYEKGKLPPFVTRCSYVHCKNEG